MDNNPVNNIDPNGMDTYYGQEAQEEFRRIVLAGGSHEDGDENKSK